MNRVISLVRVRVSWGCSLVAGATWKPWLCAAHAGDSGAWSMTPSWRLRCCFGHLGELLFALVLDWGQGHVKLLGHLRPHRLKLFGSGSGSEGVLPLFANGWVVGCCGRCLLGLAVSLGSRRLVGLLQVFGRCAAGGIGVVILRGQTRDGLESVALAVGDEAAHALRTDCAVLGDDLKLQDAAR